MPRDGQGKFSLLLNNWNPAVQGNDADPEGWMQLISDIATALTQSVADDGQTVMVGPLNMGDNKIRNVGAPTNSKDAIRRQTLAKGSNISSAETISIPSEGMVFEVTGTNNISDIIGGSYDGRVAILVFRAELEIQQSESIYLPGGANITTKAGDVYIFIRKEMDKWHGLQTEASQRAVVNSDTDISGGNKLVTQGWMGLGSTSGNLNGGDLNDLNYTTFFSHSQGDSPENTPVDSAGVGISFQGYPSDWISQLWLTRGTPFRAFGRSSQSPGNPGSWEEFLHTGNIASQLDARYVRQSQYMPIGFCYTQYDGTSTPSSLFGGTWTLMFNTDGVFFRTEGEGAAGFGGIQGDTMRNVTGTFGFRAEIQGSSTGPFRQTATGTRPTGSSGTGGRIDFDISRSVPTSSEFRPRNRTVRVWRKTSH